MTENKDIRRRISFGVLTGLFFIWGFIISMNNILIPYFKGIFELSYFQAMLVQFAFFGSFFIGSLGYFVLSVRIGDPIAKIGYRNGMCIGLIVAAAGCLLFYPAATFQNYGFFLGALFCLGLGVTFLQIAANPYAALLGSEETASSRLNLAQGINSLGTIIGPLLGGFLIFGYFFDPLSAGADSVQTPYILFSGVFLLLALLVRMTPFPEFHRSETPEKGFGLFRFPQILLGVAAIFMSIGTEVTTGSILINYLGLDNIAGLNESEASKYVAFYWGGLMIGRLTGAALFSGTSAKNKAYLISAVVAAAIVVVVLSDGIRITGIFGSLIAANLLAFYLGRFLPGRTLGVFALAIIALLGVAFLSSGQIAVWSVIGVGLFISISWSNIFTLSIRGVGKYTTQASSLLIMAILGAALIPPLQGLAADHFGIQNSLLVILATQIYIVWYGFWGCNKVKIFSKN
jgi:FHS family L-fucose permease-like MFS transporter